MYITVWVWPHSPRQYFRYRCKDSKLPWNLCLHFLATSSTTAPWPPAIFGLVILSYYFLVVMCQCHQFVDFFFVWCYCCNCFVGCLLSNPQGAPDWRAQGFCCWDAVGPAYGRGGARATKGEDPWKGATPQTHLGGIALEKTPDDCSNDNEALRPQL